MRAGGDRFRGIRHGVSWEAETAALRPNPSIRAGMLADKNFREGVAVVDRLGLSYDVSLYHPQIGEAADLASALPNGPNRPQSRRRRSRTGLLSQ